MDVPQGTQAYLVLSPLLGLCVVEQAQGTFSVFNPMTTTKS